MSNPRTPASAQVDPSEGPFDEAQAFEQETFAAAEADEQETATLDHSDDSGAIVAE